VFWAPSSHECYGWGCLNSSSFSAASSIATYLSIEFVLEFITSKLRWSCISSSGS
jgi:hypothetical protein